MTQHTMDDISKKIDPILLKNDSILFNSETINTIIDRLNSSIPHNTKLLLFSSTLFNLANGNEYRMSWVPQGSFVYDRSEQNVNTGSIYIFSSDKKQRILDLSTDIVDDFSFLRDKELSKDIGFYFQTSDQKKEVKSIYLIDV
jgi:hypothetical protein